MTRTPELNIRWGKPEDAGALARLRARSWRNAYTGILPHKALQTIITRFDVDYWRRLLGPANHILVMTFDGQPIGYASIGANVLSRYRDDFAPWRGEITELYLDPDYQGLGFGSQLFQAAREHLKILGYAPGLLVWALADNEIACRFYQRRGGELFRIVKDCFGGHPSVKHGFVWPG